MLSHRSGIPDIDMSALDATLSIDPLRVWATTDVLDPVPADRVLAGVDFDYTDNNYLLIGLVIEQVRG